MPVDILVSFFKFFDVALLIFSLVKHLHGYKLKLAK